MAGWDTLPHLIRDELRQREEEGCDTASLRAEIEAAGEDGACLEALYARLMALPVRADFPFFEPSELETIRSERTAGPRCPEVSLSETEWRDRFLGAWLGRCAGCILGKPLESRDFMFGAAGNPGWENVRRWFEGADAWPIDGYTPEHSRAEATTGIHLNDWSRPSTREHIHAVQSDDDLRYTVLGLMLLEEKGLDFDTWDVGRFWHQHLTYAQVCTAETQAYLNFALVTAHMQQERPPDWRERLAQVPLRHNPYREWIGAQIRADPWGYVAAGYPELAAGLAWRDASLSHVRNGIYGAMFVAAMIAAAFAVTDPEQIVAIGLSEIPHRSRLYHDISRAVEIARRAQDQLELAGQLWEAFAHYHPVHTNNNAAVVAASLIHARGDFEKAITTAVLCGWDTDCNGATVGSIMGACRGAAAIPRRWTAPFNDTLYAEIPGFHPIAISECARRTYEVFVRLRPDAHTR